MAGFVHSHGRLHIYFSDHALDRWWERQDKNHLLGRRGALALLRERLTIAARDPRRTYTITAPPWSRLSIWHRARAEGFLLVGDDACFVINRNESGDHVAVTYLEHAKEHIKERQEVAA